ncbi:hypothetical protein VTJ49DRAFT_2350 [Mycothermus thermophilus]|uniref:DH domain-containing protein n=1 Tax=Humicola insolens TaxID=85995 RepID=A0ABR3VRM4_HUMIN
MDHGSLGDEPAPHASGAFLDHLQSPLSPLVAQQHQYFGNLHAFAASQDSHDDVSDPADFYRSFHSSAQPTSTTTTTTADVTSPVNHQDPMALAAVLTSPGGGGSSRGTGATTTPPTTTSSSRKVPSLRSNSNGTTPKHPTVPPSHRPALRSGQRSASSNPDTRSGISGSGGRTVSSDSTTSVKDLKKRFDHSSASQQSGSAIPKKSHSRSSARDASSSPVNKSGPGFGAGSGTSHSTATTTRSTAARDTGRDSTTTRSSAARRAPRARSSTRDSSSASSQSFASRIARPRTSGSTATLPSRPVAAAPPRQTGLLFGEILPEQSDSVTPGFGIEFGRPRRTSESSIINPVRPLMRSLSDPDVEPPSPTDWYRAALPGTERAAEHNQQNHSASSRVPKSHHSRARSDLAGTKLTLNRPDFDATKRDVDSPLSPTSPTSPTSRLPRLARRPNHDISGRASPASTRSSSPSTLRPTTTSRSTRQHVSSSSRSKTPTTAASGLTRSSSSSNTSSSSRKAPPASISTPPNSRLNAYVSVPPPKLSPGLRSSRPRQSVATATTAASRMRAADRGVSPLRTSQRSAPKTEEQPQSRRRKVSVGPIDFAQRRETIKLAYSKSIRESQAREARQAAAERRKKELAAVAKAKQEAEAAAAAAAAAASASATPVTLSRKSTRERLRPSESPSEPVPSIEGPKPTHDVSTPQQAPGDQFPTPSERLILSIPGSFPDDSPSPDHDEIPRSAVSMVSGVTEFDTEVQTEMPVQEERRALDIPRATTPSSCQTTEDSESVERPLELPDASATRQRASYQYPFGDGEDDSVSIKISLDASIAVPQGSTDLTPTRPAFESQPEHVSAPPPPEPEDDDEYVPRPYKFSDNYETTVTILGRNRDFQPSHKDSPRTAIPQNGSPSRSSPATSAPQIVGPGSPSHGDARFEDPGTSAEDLNRLEDFYLGPRLGDSVAALREPSYAASDADTPSDVHTSRDYYRRAADTSQGLTVPGLLAPGNRLSHHSAWTDFSIGSEDPHPCSTPQSHDADAHDHGASVRAVPSTGDLSTCASSLGDPTAQSPDSTPLNESGILPSSMPPDPASGNLSRPSSEFIPPPDLPSPPAREPPLPPPAELYQRDSNTLYLAESRPNSHAYSQDGQAGDAPELTSPPQSVSQVETSQVSLGDTLCEGQAPLTEKEQEELKRLRQRQLVIRELIDTEDTFIRDLTVVEEIYKGTAEACPNLDSKTIKVIFRNTDEIIAFHTALLAEFKEGATTVYTPKGRRTPPPGQESKESDAATLNSVSSANRPERTDERDRLTSIGPVFTKNIEQLKAVHEIYLRSSDSSTKRLLQIQEDKTVALWLNECNEVAKELTTAWNLDSLLIKPMQRITKYPDIITHLLKFTPDDHPDREPLIQARTAVIEAIDDINRTKKNFELVGQIVSNRKRKESDVRAGLARAFGKRVDKLQVAGTKTAEDEEYVKLQQQFGDDYLRLQVVLRDVEYYTRNVASYVHDFLQYLSSMELVMRLQPSRDYAHIESKWVQFNVLMRDIEKIALERHLADVRKHVIEPFEQVIRCYSNPSLAMKKRAKRRLDYERYMALKANGKKVDKQLAELVEQYEALNDTLKKELPKLSALTARVGNICLGKFICIQASWFSIWKEKVKVPLSDTHVPELAEIVSSFQREFALQEERLHGLGILNPAVKTRTSQSTADDASSTRSKHRQRPNDIVPPRGRGLSVNSDQAPSLPTPDFVKRNSGQFSLSPASSALPSPANFYRDWYAGVTSNNSSSTATYGHTARNSSVTSSPVAPAIPDTNAGPRSTTTSIGGAPLMRPSTGRSYDSVSLPRQSTESAAAMTMSSLSRRDSGSTFNSSYFGGGQPQQHQHQQSMGGAPSISSNSMIDQQPRRLSGLFHSALPLPDGPEDGGGTRSSRASSRDRGGDAAGYNVLWLAASLFEFNIKGTKLEAGYPYLTYQAGEIFDVIAEKGELWLAKNQDDPDGIVGWIWSKHFAKLADS